ncbi:hypothetical protein JTE90_008953 [Oedothorax gibbosus]|uniref:Uncharacterized protein n=1 Tax=Oedothorax gibbosus TaxID=931172 RepID=A0AAV6UWW1_9ARAC|nr:hypothetical protein JTE90_008953 [Oedothorax gibbosus]
MTSGTFRIQDKHLTDPPHISEAKGGPELKYGPPATMISLWNANICSSQSNTSQQHIVNYCHVLSGQLTTSQRIQVYNFNTRQSLIIPIRNSSSSSSSDRSKESQEEAHGVE